MAPVLLDLFCGAGGASEGYSQAGFTVLGVDAVPQPNYPFDFFEMDAVEALEHLLIYGSFRDWHVDAVHASPPCQRWSTATADASRHPDLIGPVRARLVESGLPFVIENVPQAPLWRPVQLCGSAFGLGVRRHRNFESNVTLFGSGCDHASQGTPVGVYGDHPDRRQHLRPDGSARGTKATSLEAGQAAMGDVFWMNWRELAESIPPAYTKHVGADLVGQLGGSDD